MGFQEKNPDHSISRFVPDRICRDKSVMDHTAEFDAAPSRSNHWIAAMDLKNTIQHGALENIVKQAQKFVTQYYPSLRFPCSWNFSTFCSAVQDDVKWRYHLPFKVDQHHILLIFFRKGDNFLKANANG